MIVLLALLVLLLLIEGVVVSAILALYTERGFGEAWSLTWSRPWIPVMLTLGSVLAGF